MALAIEKILSDACNLSMRLKEHDFTADSLITRTQSLQHQVEAMKQYQENLNELNEIARHRPRASLILSLAQENSQIRELQQENKELRESLEEHQTALELIMSKYREQMSELLKADRLERAYVAKNLDCSEEMNEKLEKIYEMAAVMWEAVKIDDRFLDRDQEIVAQLMKENASMRELLQISTSYVQNSAALHDEDTQTEGEFFLQQPDNLEPSSELSSPEEYRSLSSSLVAKSLDDSGIGLKKSATSYQGSPSDASETVATATGQAEIAVVLRQMNDISKDLDTGDDHDQTTSPL